MSQGQQQGGSNASDLAGGQSVSGLQSSEASLGLQELLHAYLFVGSFSAWSHGPP